MITEDYVSFETAKLLKEKGFDNDIICTDCWYDEDGDLHRRGNYSYSGAPVYHKDTCCNAPTLQMAAKWLRVKNIFIDIFHYNSKMAPFVWLIFAYNVLIPQRAETYEEALESAINYILNNWDEVNTVLDDYYKYDKYLPKI